MRFHSEHMRKKVVEIIITTKIITTTPITAVTATTHTQKKEDVMPQFIRPLQISFLVCMHHNFLNINSAIHIKKENYYTARIISATARASLTSKGSNDGAKMPLIPNCTLDSCLYHALFTRRSAGVHVNTFIVNISRFSISRCTLVFVFVTHIALILVIQSRSKRTYSL